jgi:hypothetical protein
MPPPAPPEVVLPSTVLALVGVVGDVAASLGRGVVIEDAVRAGRGGVRG